MSAVWFRGPCAFTFAPFESNCSTTSTLPDRDATITGVSPASNTTFGFAPACRSRRTIALLPFMLAVHNAVAPRSFALLTFAPALISNSALSPSSR